MKVGPTSAARWRRYVTQLLARELSAVTKYYDRLIQWLPREEDDGSLLDIAQKPVEAGDSGDQEFPDLTGERISGRRSWSTARLIIISTSRGF